MRREACFHAFFARDLLIPVTFLQATAGFTKIEALTSILHCALI